MSRVDHGTHKDRVRDILSQVDPNPQRGPIGPFLKLMSGYNPSRNQKNWYTANADPTPVWTPSVHTPSNGQLPSLPPLQNGPSTGFTLVFLEDFEEPSNKPQ